jgi:hypothetical protein
LILITKAGQYNLIKTIMKMQIALEDSFAQLAQNSGQKAVLICDRGVLDNQAYFPGLIFLNIYPNRQRSSNVEHGINRK